MGEKIFLCIFYLCIAIAVCILINIDNGTQFFIWWLVCLFVVPPVLGLIGYFLSKLDDRVSDNKISSTSKAPSENLNNKSNDLKIETKTQKRQDKTITSYVNSRKNSIIIQATDWHSKDKITYKKEVSSNNQNIVTIEQREALLKIAIDFCYCSPERLYLWKGQYEILLEFAKILKLEKNQLDAYIQEISGRFFRTSIDNAKTLDYYEVVKTIQQDEPFIHLINTCGKLLDFIDSLDEELTKTEYYAYLIFPKLLENIGFTQKEIKDIKYGEGIYKTRKGNSIIPLGRKKEIQIPIEQEYPVSKEQMAIFKKNWTLPQFRKEFGVENRVESRKNHTWDEDYKVCIFIKNSDSSEFDVGFSNSLREPSIEEIQRREKELMVGLSEYGRYKLYDNKIAVISDSQEIDLGI